jgi:hypothetical protein
VEEAAGLQRQDRVDQEILLLYLLHKETMVDQQTMALHLIIWDQAVAQGQQVIHLQDQLAVLEEIHTHLFLELHNLII